MAVVARAMLPKSLTVVPRRISTTQWARLASTLPEPKGQPPGSKKGWLAISAAALGALGLYNYQEVKSQTTTTPKLSYDAFQTYPVKPGDTVTAVYNKDSGKYQVIYVDRQFAECEHPGGTLLASANHHIANRFWTGKLAMHTTSERVTELIKTSPLITVVGELDGPIPTEATQPIVLDPSKFRDWAIVYTTTPDGAVVLNAESGTPKLTKDDPLTPLDARFRRWHALYPDGYGPETTVELQIGEKSVQTTVEKLGPKKDESPTTLRAIIQCAGSGRKDQSPLNTTRSPWHYDATYQSDFQGVPLKDKLAELLGMSIEEFQTPEYKGYALYLEGSDGYHTVIPFEDIPSNALLASKVWDPEAKIWLPIPTRAIFPGLAGHNMINHLVKIKVLRPQDMPQGVPDWKRDITIAPKLSSYVVKPMGEHQPEHPPHPSAERTEEGYRWIDRHLPVRAFLSSFEDADGVSSTQDLVLEGFCHSGGNRHVTNLDITLQFADGTTKTIHQNPVQTAPGQAQFWRHTIPKDTLQKGPLKITLKATDSDGRTQPHTVHQPDGPNNTAGILLNLQKTYTLIVR